MFVARLLDQGEHLGKACKRLRGLLCGTQMLKLAFPIRLCDPDIFFLEKTVIRRDNAFATRDLDLPARAIGDTVQRRIVEHHTEISVRGLSA